MNDKLNTSYYAVIFTSTLEMVDDDYKLLNHELYELAKMTDGFIAMDSARDAIGISVSYWSSLDAIRSWRSNIDHQNAINKGIEKYYKNYHVKICEVIREYSFDRIEASIEII